MARRHAGTGALSPEVVAISGYATFQRKLDRTSVNGPSASRIARDSHYVPLALLRRWSQDGTHLFAHRLLVASSNVPEWRRRSIKGIAYQRDLYTTFAGEQELDTFERWLSAEFEQPALERMDRLLRGLRLKPADWRHLARFVAAQDVRTPLNFVESMKRWNQEIPETLNRTLEESIERLKTAAEAVRREPPIWNEFSDVIRVKIERSADQTSDEISVRAEVPIGRRFWIAAMRHLLTGAAEILCRHRWSVAAPAGDEEWPLTDHPVLRLNYYKPGRYDFGGGWGHPGSEIMMPVSPKHLLYVQVGRKAPNRFTFSTEQTRLVQRLLVERAHRWVFATQPTQWIAEARPRIVDPEQVAAEKEAWEEWHEDQSTIERP